VQSFYAGIGSRDTPDEIQGFMNSIGEFLAKKNLILRSGGARGADTAFEEGCDSVQGEKHIYLPWIGFNGHTSPLHIITISALELAQTYHPHWGYLRDPEKRLMARNGYQILGADLKTPVEFVICWTKAGKITGGTGQALRIACDRKIPVWNLANKKDLQYWKNLMQKIEIKFLEGFE
jgi:hypothetical protein